MDLGVVATALEECVTEDAALVEDIDKADHGNPQLCSEYVNEIYVYMRMLEVNFICWNGIPSFLHWTLGYGNLFTMLKREGVKMACRVSTAFFLVFSKSIKCGQATWRGTTRSTRRWGASWLIGSSRFTWGSGSCQRLCTSQSPSSIDSYRYLKSTR